MATRLNHALRTLFGIITALTLCLLVACSSGGSGQAVSANGTGSGNANKAIGPNDTWTNDPVKPRFPRASGEP